MSDDWFNGFVDYLKADDPGIDLQATQDSMHDLAARPASGWLIILGEPDFVGPIENAIYPPNTPKNEDFQVMLMHHPFGNHAWLAKKNDELAAYLQNQFDVTVDDVMALQVLIYDPPSRYPVPPGTLYQAPDGTGIAIAGAGLRDLEIFLYMYLKLTRYRS